MEKPIFEHKPDAIIFDWDGTLANTRPCVVSALEQTLTHYKRPKWDTIKVSKRDTSKSLKANFPNFFAEKAEEAYEFYLNTYQQQIKRLQAQHHAKDLVSSLDGLNIPLFIVSNKDRTLLTQEVRQLFPDMPFQAIIGHDDALYQKPHPAPVFKALENTKFHPNKNLIWLIGDTKQDTDCAYASGCLPILIGKRGFMTQDYIGQNMQSPAPLVQFESLENLQTVIASPHTFT